MRYRFGVLTAALWWGSLTGLGFVMVPMLFSILPSPAAAGSIAAKLFTAQTWLSIACAMLLLLVFNPKQDLGQDTYCYDALPLLGIRVRFLEWLRYQRGTEARLAPFAR